MVQYRIDLTAQSLVPFQFNLFNILIMTNDNSCKNKAKKEAVKAAAQTVLIGATASILLASPVGWGLTAYYAYRRAKEAYDRNR